MAKSKSTAKSSKTNSKARTTEKNFQLQSLQPAYRGKKKRYYNMLVELQDQLIDEVRTLSSHSLSFNKQAGEELADIGSDNFTREIELGVMTEEGRRIRLIQDAIERLKDNSYGVCLDCRNSIQEGRLKAIPYAKFCIQCKSRRERDPYENFEPDQDHSSEDVGLTE